MSSSKDAKDKRKSVDDSLHEHYEAFNMIATAYVQVLASMQTMSSIREMMLSGIGKACKESLGLSGIAGEDASGERGRDSYALAMQRSVTERIHVPGGPTVAIPRTVNIVIGPRSEAAGRYASSQETKEAVLKSIVPGEVGLKVSRLTKIRNNGIKIETCEVDLGKLRSSDGLRDVGLEVRDEVKLNPRVIIRNVPVELSSEEIIGQLSRRNLNGEGDNLKMVYRFPAHAGRAFSSCVVEVPPDIRKRLLAKDRIFLGWSACTVGDHVRVLQCFRCLSFGHIAKNCTSKEARCSYCSEDHETRVCTNTGLCNDLRICHVNCQSLFVHLDQFRNYFENCSYHVICLSETRLKPGITDAMVHLPNYALLKCDRLGKNGGGVGVYVHSSLSAKLLYATDGLYRKCPEFMFLEISCASMPKVLIAVVYRPPKAGYFRDFEDKCIELFSGYQNLIILKNLNNNLLIDGFDAKLLREFIFANGLFLVPYNATCHTSTSSTLLDLCILDDEQKLSKFGQCPVPFLSMHDLIFVRLRLRVARVSGNKLKRRDFHKLHAESFLADLDSCDWEEFVTAGCADRKVEIFNSNLTEVLNTHAPMREWVYRRRPAPWLTGFIVQRMRERDRARRAWRRHRKPELYGVFKSLRNEVQSRIRGAKRNHYRETLSRKQGISPMWGKLRRLGLIGALKAPDLRGLDLDELNRAFCSHARAGAGCNSVADDMVVLDTVQFDDAEFFFSDISPSQLLRVASRGGSEAVGVDGISARCLRLGLPSLLPYLVHLFNFLLQHSLFPELWRRALVRPLPKVKSPASCSDYRSISLLCTVSKVLKRIVSEQVVDYLEANHLFDDF
ncbi:rna-directed dna polymerase from mobile element jockey-like protein [Lasius niger]|uniref:Rna-directed dna polymerase from mobile element jockey-like protein n=1 Tax=Lasius niger TaxID=67767 RepID=A0A0J7NDM1_LASNI|nr:rna-directed dna polymerase from mobile element jockey-like protein [Lasius niger]